MPTIQPVPHRSRNRRGQGERLRIELLDAAARLMAEQGTIESVTLRAVASRAGVSPTAVYRHFRDHDELVHHAMLWCWTWFDIELAESLDSGASPVDRFRAMALVYCRFATEEAGIYGVLFGRGIEPTDEIRAFRADIYGKLVDVVAAILAEAGDERDAYFVAGLAHSWVHGIVGLWTDEPGSLWPPLELLIDEVVFNLGLCERPG